MKTLHAKIGELALENDFLERALGISRGAVYYVPRPTSALDLALMRAIDALHLDFPFAGARMLRRLLRKDYPDVGRRRIGTLMLWESQPSVRNQARVAGAGRLRCSRISSGIGPSPAADPLNQLAQTVQRNGATSDSDAFATFQLRIDRQTPPQGVGQLCEGRNLRLAVCG